MHLRATLALTPGEREKFRAGETLTALDFFQRRLLGGEG